MPINQRVAPFPVTWTIGPTLGTTQLTADKTVVVWRAPYRAQLVDAGFCFFDTALAKSATNYAIVSVINAGAAGAGTSIIATVSLKSTTLAVNTPKALALAATVAWLKLDAGDYVAVKYDETGTLTLFNIYGSFGVMYGHDA